MKKRIKISRENIVKRLVGTVALMTSAATITIATACTEEEMDQAIDKLNQMATEQTTSTETTQDIDIPMDTDKPEETPEDNTNVDEPVEEPVEDQIEEVNPRDMQAVYGLDFEVPIYTEEEVAEAQKYLEDNEESIPYLVKDVIPGTDIEAYRNVIDEDKIEEISHNYYIVNQDNIYKAYSQFAGLDYDALNNDHVTGFIDEENNAFATITYEKLEKKCSIHYFNKDTKIAISIGIGGENTQNEEEIGKLSFVKYVRIAPNATLSVINPDYFEMECESDEILINKIPDMFIATPDTINNYKLDSANANKPNTLKLD